MTGSEIKSWWKYARRFTTKRQTDWWKDRKIDWVKQYSDTWKHPHRQFIVDMLKKLRWVSVVEIGCASGPNLIRIANDFPNADVGGVDPNKDAIDTANAIFKSSGRFAWFKVGTGDDVMMSDESTDIVLTDMTLIYVAPLKIRKYLEEMRRISRKYVVMLEFHSTNPWKRLWMKIRTGYNVYNYRKLMEEAGFHEITVDKLPPELWDNGEPQKTYAYLIVGRK